MLRLGFVLFFLLLPQVSHAEGGDCSALKNQKQELEKRMEKVILSYPNEVSFYGFSRFMVRGVTDEDTGNFILKIADLVKGCVHLIEGKSCNFAARDIIQMISSGHNICVANQKYRCGVC